MRAFFVSAFGICWQYIAPKNTFFYDMMNGVALICAMPRLVGVDSTEFAKPPIHMGYRGKKSEVSE
jgi:hypothetical protein